MIDRVYVQPIRDSGQSICFFHSACLRTSPVLFFVIGSESINRLVYVSCICLNVMCGFFCASHKSSIADDQPTFLQAQTIHEQLCSKGGAINTMAMFKEIPIAKCEHTVEQYGCTKLHSSILLSQLRGIHSSKMPPFAERPKTQITAMWLPGATELEYGLERRRFLLL